LHNATTAPTIRCHRHRSRQFERSLKLLAETQAEQAPSKADLHGAGMLKDLQSY